MAAAEAIRASYRHLYHSLCPLWSWTRSWRQWMEYPDLDASGRNIADNAKKFTPIHNKLGLANEQGNAGENALNHLGLDLERHS